MAHPRLAHATNSLVPDPEPPDVPDAFGTIEDVVRYESGGRDEGIFDMSGGTPEHSALAATTIAELHGALRGRPCRVHDSNMAIKIQDPKKRLVYPDASVVCGRFGADPERIGSA